MKIGRVVILSTMLSIGLSSCIPPRYSVYTRDCIIFRKVELPIIAQQWLREANPVPEFVEFLDRVADNNDRFDENCPNLRNEVP